MILSGAEIKSIQSGIHGSFSLIGLQVSSPESAGIDLFVVQDEILQEAGKMWDMFADTVFMEATFGADGKVVVKIGDESNTSDYTVTGNMVCIKGDDDDTVFVVENDGEKLVCGDIESGREVVMVRK